MSTLDWEQTLQVNLTAPFMLIMYALPHLIRKMGSIVRIGSIEGLGSNPRHPAHCASKGGLHALTRLIRAHKAFDAMPLLLAGSTRNCTPLLLRVLVIQRKTGRPLAGFTR
jgi:hypothetical protein